MLKPVQERRGKLSGPSTSYESQRQLAGQQNINHPSQMGLKQKFLQAKYPTNSAKILKAQETNIQK